MRMHLPFRARFKESVDEILGLDVPLPALLAKHAALVSQPAGGVRSVSRDTHLFDSGLVVYLA